MSRHMIYREFITRAAQEEWFASIDNERNYYWLIHYRNDKVGLANIKEIEYELKSGEGGIFLWVAELRNSLFVYRVAVTCIDWAFSMLKLNSLHCRVLRENRRAIRYNRSLGYAFSEPPEGGAILEGRLSREAYQSRRPILVAPFEVDTGAPTT